MTTEFKCDLCDRKFNHQCRLKTHIKKIHLKIKDIACEICDFKCFTNNHLKRHKKAIHDKIKDFECKLCDYKCSDICRLTLHLNSVHKKLKEFECTLCVRKCSTKGDLNMHLKSIHFKIKDFECKLCDSKFSANNNLKRHVKQVHERSQESKKMSLGEFKINTILKKFKVEFKQEFKFQNLISYKDRRLRFDFGIKNKNNYLLIEFDGRQHFEKVRWNSYELEKQINDKYDYIQQCDKQKNDYVSSNNHQLLRIRYDDIDVQNKILDFIIKHYDTNIWQNNQRTI